MSHSELRNIFLKMYFEATQGIFGSTAKIEPQHFDFPITEREIHSINKQLSDLGLINFCADGYCDLTTGGIDEAQGVKTNSVDFKLGINNSTIISNSNGVNIGSHNPTINFNAENIEKLMLAIDSEKATFEEKQEAKSLLKKILESSVSKLVVSAISGLFMRSLN